MTNLQLLSPVDRSPSQLRPYQFIRRSILTGDYVWQIESDWVRTFTWLEDGTIVTLGVWGPGDFISKVLTQVEPYDIECLTKVTAYRISKNEWQATNENLLAYGQQTETFLVIRSHKRIDQMLIQLLRWLGQRFGSHSQNGLMLDCRLTHQDLADMLGVTRVSVTRFMQKLEQDGLIQRLNAKQILLREEEIWHYQI